MSLNSYLNAEVYTSSNFYADSQSIYLSNFALKNSYINCEVNNSLYNNFIDVLKSSERLNEDCYITDKNTVIDSTQKQKVFSTSSVAELKNKWIHPRDIPSQFSNDFFLAPITIGLILFCIVFIRYAKYLGKYFEGIIYSYVAEKFIDDINVPTKRLLMFLDTIALIALSFLIFEILQKISAISSLEGIKIFGIIFSATLVYRVYSFLVHKGIEVVLQNRNLMQKLYFDWLITYRAGGVIIFPVSIFIFFSKGIISDYLLYAAIAIFILLFLYRFFRLLKLFIKNGVSFLYFILYLCALEIVPLAIVYLKAQKI